MPDYRIKLNKHVAKKLLNWEVLRKSVHSRWLKKFDTIQQLKMVPRFLTPYTSENTTNYS